MGKGHRDNYAARKSRGSKAFNKKKERRKVKHNCAWWVEFECGKSEYISIASNQDINELAIRQHQHDNCKIIKYRPQD
jgi:hypothetical protein